MKWKKVTIEFESTDERDTYLNLNYPNRIADKDEAGKYKINNGTIFVYLTNVHIVEINKKW
jgi:hypothetical protein